MRYPSHHVRGGHARFAPADGPGTDAAGLVVPPEDLGNAPVGYLEDAWDIAGPRAAVGELDDLLAGGVGQGTAVHEDATELVDATVPYWDAKRRKYKNINDLNDIHVYRKRH